MVEIFLLSSKENNIKDSLNAFIDIQRFHTIYIYKQQMRFLNLTKIGATENKRDISSEALMLIFNE